MRWFSSKLVRDDPEAIIEHEFVCQNCEQAERMTTKFTPIHVLPDKLSAPQIVAVAAWPLLQRGQLAELALPVRPATKPIPRIRMICRQRSRNWPPNGAKTSNSEKQKFS
jgi:hypothetical protein